MQSGDKELASKFDADPDEVVELYDEWADGYDEDLANWGYVAPQVASRYLTRLVRPGTHVLDAGCGTGLVGAALAADGFTDIVGIDISEQSLARARRGGVYSTVSKQDLQVLPLSLPERAFGALVCVGVMSYLPEVEATCREFCRLVAPDGVIILTQRTDLFDRYHTRQAFDALAADHSWEIIEVTEPRDYLPGHSEFADEIGVRYGVFRRL